MRTTLTTIAAAVALMACTADTSEPVSPTPLPSASSTDGGPTSSPTPDPAPSSPATPSPTADDDDELGFEDGAECENEEIGYEIEYPGGWWANEPVEGEGQVAGIMGCAYFAPEEVELQPGTDDLTGVAVRIDIVEGDVDRGGEILRDEEATIAGRPARVLEREPEPQPGFVDEGERIFQIIVELDGRELVATTDTINQDESRYEESREVLATMLETLELDD